MTSNVEYKPCPSCGTLLLASLVDAINNPSQPESCPHFAEVKTLDRQLLEAVADVFSEIPNVTVHIGLPFMDYESAQA